MNTDLRAFLADFTEGIESALELHLPVSSQDGAERFNDALYYSVFPGGKRWRPVLSTLAGMVCGLPRENMLPVACAIEYLHTSSIIIDDLPSMDDAELRRGKPTLHLAFGESTALLVSISLLNKSYALLAEGCVLNGGPGRVADLIAKTTHVVGSNGMTGGQFVDLEKKSRDLSLKGLASRNLKTTALTDLMMSAGPIMAGADAEHVKCLARLGEAIGTAYQIMDDIADVTGDPVACGKPVRQDERHARPSVLTECDTAEAHRLARVIVEDAVDDLVHRFGTTGPVLILAEAVSAVFQMPIALAPAA